MPADRRTYLKALSLELRKAWPAYRPHYIICHGHSVVTGAMAGKEVRPFDAYPHLWHKLLHEKYPTALLSMIVTAIGGENAMQGAERFRRDVLDRRPDLITIDYALNDRQISLAQAREAWESMLEEAANAGIPVLLLTPTMDVPSVYDKEQRDLLQAHAAQIRSLADEWQVGLVDSYAVFERYLAQGGTIEELLSWPNHPNRLGHELIARQLAAWFPMD